MPWASRGSFGEECPLGKFRVDVAAGGGCHDKDPVEACIVGCNWFDADAAREGKLEDGCRCPVDMTWSEYDKLRDVYPERCKRAGIKATKEGFWAFAECRRDDCD